MPTDTSLFRPDAISHRYQRSDGPPLQLGHSPWRWSSLLLAACALGVILFLWLGEYTRKARAMGQLVPVAGLLRVHAPQAGTLASLAVHEGQQVQAGQVLLRLYSDRAVAGGEVQQQVLRQLDTRSQSLQQSRQTLAALYATRRAEASHKVAQLQSQLDGLIRQTALAQSRSALAGKALQRQQQLVAEGFVSAASLEDKQAELMQADGQVAALQAAQAEVARLLASARAEAQQLPLAADNENRSLGRDLSALAGERALQQGRREITIVAPLGGLVTALQARPGMAIAEQEALLAIVPAPARYQAELYVPSRDIGFIRPGMAVTLRYQAFPYQKFGVQRGSVQEVTRAVLNPAALPAGLPEKESYYRLLVNLAQQHVSAYGRPQTLQSGMKLEADVLVERRQLWEWLLEPLLGLQRSVAGSAHG